MNPNKIFAWCFNFFRRWKVKENQITLIEKLNTGGTGSLFELKAELERRGKPFSYNIITHADYEVRPGNIKRLFLLFTRKAYRMATSSYIFLNDNFLPLAYMKPAGETKIVQLWHGMGSFKKFGGSTEKDPEVRTELETASRNTDHILASSENIKKNYAEAFMVPEEKVLCIGCPQADYYFKKHNIAAWKEELYARYPDMRGKKLVLYAPTFRGDAKRDRELLSAFDFAKFKKELGEEYYLMVRLHPQINSARVPEGVADMTAYKNIRKLLCMTDILIADYSSIAVEYSLLNRPIILYAFDKEWYLNKDRGFYFDYEKTAPGPVVETMEELISCIREKKWDLEKVDQFAHLHNDFFDDRSAERVADYYFGKEQKMKVIAGLGNPTDQYKGTRHNVGFMAIDRLAQANHIDINQHKFKAMVGSGIIGGQKVLLVKPLTYMNLSGESLRAVVDFYKVEPEDLLVIYDDISLEPGMLRIRTKGSAGGHNGMKSIIKHLGCDTFPRVRVGIGGEKHPGQDLADYVLGHFKEEEKEDISGALDKAARAAEMFARGNLAEAMNQFSVGKKKRKEREN